MIDQSIHNSKPKKRKNGSGRKEKELDRVRRKGGGLLFFRPTQLPSVHQPTILKTKNVKI